MTIGRQASGIPLCATGLRLVVEPVAAGRLAPAVMLRVYCGGVATSSGATLPAGEAERLAALILAAGRCAAEDFAIAPLSAPGPDAE